MLCGAAKETTCNFGYRVLSELVEVLEERRARERVVYITESYRLAGRDPFEILVQAAAAVWAKIAAPAELKRELATRIARAKAAGLSWYAEEGADILTHLRGKGVGEHPVGARLARLVVPRERWADALGALLGLAAPKSPTPQYRSATRRGVVAAPIADRTRSTNTSGAPS